MKFYRIFIDFGSDLDLKGKIAASLLIRKMIERLGNEYEIKVNSVQDTRCEIILKDNSGTDRAGQIRAELAGMTGSMTCQIRVELEGGSTAGSDSSGDPAAGLAESIQAEFDRRRRQQDGVAPEDDSALGRIRSLVGADEFKALTGEIARMAPHFKALKGQSYLQRNTYLFSIDDGYGLTTSLKLFAEMLYECKLIPSPTVAEVHLGSSDEIPPDALTNILKKLEHSVVCFDLTQCQSDLDKPGFRAALRPLASMDNYVFIFRVPFMEQKALNRIVAVLDDIFFLRTVTFIPMDFEDLSECAARAAKRYGYTLDPSVEPILAQLMAHEKSDGRFYGIRSAEKLVDKMVYEKLRISAPGSEVGGVITAADLKELDQEFEDLQNLSGEEQLKQLIGMEPVAKQLHEIVALIEYAVKNAKSSSRPSIHMRFVGNPGTGKTTVARILGQMLKERGILRKGIFFEYEGVDLIAKYVGHTAPKTAAICRDAYGSVLFIDEAYSLAVDKDHGGGTASYNSEALNTLLSEMENHRDDMVVIMAGYKDDIDDLMRSNPGLVQRMPYEINFPNYTREQLSEIFFALARKDFLFGEEFIEKVREYFTTLPNNIYLSPTFANARFVRNLFERTWSKAVMRAQLEKADLTTLLPSDFEQAAEEMDATANGAMVFGKDASGATMFAEEDAKIRFADVRGQEEAKELLVELVDFLKNPAKYKVIGAKIPKGALLYGPPGTGKTMLAKAVAGEAGVPVLTISGSDLVDRFVGQGAEKVRGLFQKARDLAPCIIFIDEIDAVGGNRSGGHSDSTLIQLLTEMDGFDDKCDIIILGATNRPEYLDPALRRPGRFDREVPVELPDLTGRMDILSHYLKDVAHEDDIDVNEVARLAAGSSGADLRNIVNEAALLALRQGRAKVAQKDLEEAIDITSVGYVKKNRIMSDHEKWVTCYHEIGHALAAALQTHSAPVQKITVVPRTSGVLGFAQQLSTSEPVMYTRTQLENRIVTVCAGRAAEEVHFHEVTTGASNDIEKATAYARAIVARYGMTDEFDMVCLVSSQQGYLGGSSHQQCSDATARAVDEKVIEIVRTQHERAFNLLKANEAKLDELAKYLYEKETITGDEFMAILEKE